MQRIYLIECTAEGADETYVGSTTQSLKARLSRHLVDAAVSEKPSRLYDYIRKHHWKNFKIKELEAYPAETRKLLRMREQHWMDTLLPSLNMRRAYGKKPRVLTRRDWHFARLMGIGRIGRSGAMSPHPIHDSGPAPVRTRAAPGD